GREREGRLSRKSRRAGVPTRDDASTDGRTCDRVRAALATTRGSSESTLGARARGRARVHEARRSRPRVHCREAREHKARAPRAASCSGGARGLAARKDYFGGCGGSRSSVTHAERSKKRNSSAFCWL